MSRSRQGKRVANNVGNYTGRGSSRRKGSTYEKFGLDNMELESPMAPRKKQEIKPLEAKNKHQQQYLSAIDNFQVVFGIGPAGVGKSWISVGYAAEQLRTGEIEKLVLVRPVSEVGKSLGHLPGTLEEKYLPFIMPVMDILYERLGKSQTDYMIKAGIIEGMPTNYIRGKTFKNCIVIADDAQNFSALEMKTLLTRVGEECKMIINGDPGQRDLPGACGMVDAISKVSWIPQVKVIEFTKDDVVRSGLVADVLSSYGE